LCVNNGGNFEKTFNNVTKLVAYLLKEYNLTVYDLKTHHDFSGKDCPHSILKNNRMDEFIEKVVVHEADKSTGDRRQKVDIYFNFICCFVPPKPEVILTAEEEAKAQKALAARNREREQNKLRMRRVREAQRAAKEAGKVSSPAG